MKFRSDIEGLRAVAVVPVIMYHGYPALIPGGFVGVDVFFVISGYLISKIVLDAAEAGTFSYLTYYRHRLRRIFPALFAMLAASTVVSVVILPPAALVEYAQTLGATALFGSNIAFYRLASYFAASSDFKPLLHTWSLAVEEQFYLVFPLLVLAIRRWTKGRYLMVLGTLLVVSLCLSVLMVSRYNPADFYLGPPRAFELLIGCVLSLDVITVITRPLWREIIAAAGLATLGACFFLFRPTTPFPGWMALLPCLGAAALIHAGKGGTSTAAKLLSLAPVRFGGAISYSLYLWHWPMLSLVRIYSLGTLGSLGTGITLAAATVIAILSWRFIEQPFRAARTTRIFRLSIAAIIVALFVSGGLILSGGLPGRFPDSSLRIFAAANDVDSRALSCMRPPNRIDAYAQNCVFGEARKSPTIAVWGDSHGAQLASAWGSGATVMEISSSACPPAIGFSPPGRSNCAQENDVVLVGLTKDRHIDTVILIAHYNGYELMWPAFRAGFEGVVKALAKAGKHVVVLEPTPEFSFSVPDALGRLVMRGRAPSSFGISLAEYRQKNSRPLEMLRDDAIQRNAEIIRTSEILCAKDFCSPYAQGHVLFFDEHHLSLTGARLLARRIALP